MATGVILPPLPARERGTLRRIPYATHRIPHAPRLRIRGE